MKRLTRPLFYVVGFGAFCACTTTRAIDVSSVEPDETVGGLVWVITKDGGPRILMRDAYRSDDSIIGLNREGRITTLPIESVEEVEAVHAGWLTPVIILPTIAATLLAAYLGGVGVWI